MKAAHQSLKSFLRSNLYQHERVQGMAEQARQTVVYLFEHYMNDHLLLNDESRALIQIAQQSGDENQVARVIADYIAGMTDRFAFAEQERIHGWNC